MFYVGAHLFFFYLFYTDNISTIENTVLGIFADDTGLIAMDAAKGKASKNS